MKNIVVVIVVVSSISLFAQNKEMNEEKRAANSIYLELGGNGGLYSFNYDRVFFGKDVLHIGGRVGVSILPHGDSQSRMLIFPLTEVNLLCGKNNSFLELGLGYTIEATKHTSQSSASFVRFGYRFQRKKRGNGFMFRIAALPLLLEGEVNFWAGVSLGYSF